jgi:hypothetical protein
VALADHPGVQILGFGAAYGEGTASIYYLSEISSFRQLHGITISGRIAYV